MTRAYWSQVKAGGLAVPDDRPLADLTTELTTMLGSPDPSMRDDLAYPTLATWVDRGVYAVSYTHLTLPTNREV